MKTNQEIITRTLHEKDSISILLFTQANLAGACCSGRAGFMKAVFYAYQDTK